MNRDANHPWLRPLWRRVALVAFCALWAAFELATGSQGWAMLAGGMAAYGAWIFLIAYDPAPEEPRPTDPSIGHDKE